MSGIGRDELLEAIRRARVAAAGGSATAMYARLAEHVQALSDDAVTLARLRAGPVDPSRLDMELRFLDHPHGIWDRCPPTELLDKVTTSTLRPPPFRQPTPLWAYVAFNPFVLLFAFSATAVVGLLLVGALAESAPAPIPWLATFVYDLLFGCHPGAPMC